MDVKQHSRQRHRNEGLHQADKQRKQHLAQHICGAAQRVGEHLEEDAVVAVQKKRPRSVGGNAKASHPQHAGKKERIVVHTVAEQRRAQRSIHADAEDKHVAKRVKDVPEYEDQVGGADLRLTVDHGIDGGHDFTSSCVSSRNTSSRLAPFTSRRSTRRFLASAVTTSSTCPSGALKATSSVLFSTRARSVGTVCSSLSMHSGTWSKVMETS